MVKKIPPPTPDTWLAPLGVKQATFNQVLGIARQKIELTGFAPSVSGLALLAGVSRATAYRCFPSRAAMLTAVVGASLGPMRTFASDHLCGVDRVMDLLKRSLPRLSKNETSFRTAVQLSLEQRALTLAGQLKEPSFRRGYRIQILAHAMEPLKTQLPEDIYLQLHKALSVVYGIESYIVLKDIWSESRKEVETTVLWMAKALVEAAQLQASARINSQPVKASRSQSLKGKT
jgi:AcrR family transcriptional regulator